MKAWAQNQIELRGAVFLTCGFLTAGAILSSCGLDPQGQSRRSSYPTGIGESDQEGEGKPGPEGEGGLDSLAAFEQTVYPLVREKSCSSCHTSAYAPFFAADDSEEAHSAVTQSRKVDFLHPEESRLVLRLSEDNHNCWSDDCSADAAVMRGAIEAWVSLMETDKDDGDAVHTTAALFFASREEKEAGADEGTLFIEAEAGTMQNFTRSDLAGRSGGQMIRTPARNGVIQPNVVAGRVTYDLDIAEAGTYRLWGLVRGPTMNQNSFWVRVDNEAFRPWRNSVTGANWEWELATDNDGNAGNVLTFNLTAGSHTIEFREREGATGLDAFVLTNDPDFRGGDDAGSGGSINVLRWDLSEKLGQTVWFEVEVEEFDDFSFKFKNPAILSEGSDVHVKGIHVGINGKFNPQNSTYSAIDMNVPSPGSVLSSAAMIVNFDKGLDEDAISIKFDEVTLK